MKTILAFAFAFAFAFLAACGGQLPTATDPPPIETPPGAEPRDPYENCSEHSSDLTAEMPFTSVAFPFGGARRMYVYVHRFEEYWPLAEEAGVYIREIWWDAGDWIRVASFETIGGYVFASWHRNSGWAIDSRVSIRPRLKRVKDTVQFPFRFRGAGTKPAGKRPIKATVRLSICPDGPANFEPPPRPADETELIGPEERPDTSGGVGTGEGEGGEGGCVSC